MVELGVINLNCARNAMQSRTSGGMSKNKNFSTGKHSTFPIVGSKMK